MESRDEFKEVLWPKNGFIYDQEFMLPAYCKPKLIPLKSLTLEKIERMQSENIEKLREMERLEKEQQNKVSAILRVLITTKCCMDIWIYNWSSFIEFNIHRRRKGTMRLRKRQRPNPISGRPKAIE